MAKIVITEFMDEAAVATLQRGHEVIYDPGLVDRPDEMAQLVGDAKALIVRNRTQVRGALLEAAPSLTTVGRLGVGLDNIDLDACKARDIAVHPATGANDLGVAEYVIATTMVLFRGAYHANAQMIAGAWPRGQLMGQEISGKTMGLVGLGSIAREVAKRAKALGMAVIAVDPFVPKGDYAWEGIGYRNLGELLGEADVISLHVPLIEATKHLIDARALANMKDSAMLINAARGGVVDDRALADALRSGRLGGAALDVFEREPLDAEMGQIFGGLSNIILTPHIAGVSVESNQRVSALIAERVLADLQ